MVLFWAITFVAVVALRAADIFTFAVKNKTSLFSSSFKILFLFFPESFHVRIDLILRNCCESYENLSATDVPGFEVILDDSIIAIAKTVAYILVIILQNFVC